MLCEFEVDSLTPKGDDVLPAGCLMTAAVNRCVDGRQQPLFA